MSALFFFTDLDLLDDYGATSAQTPDDAYGPQGTTKFRLNSKHKSNSTVPPKAYAVTKGQILIHPITGDDAHVNLILKPLDQPAENAGIGLPRIKYLIYRHVLTNSLIVSGSGSTPPTFVSAGTIGMIDTIRATYHDKDISEPPVDTFLTSGALADPIDSAFADRSLPPIIAGASIGLFDPNSFSVEILLDDLGFEPDLTLASWNPDEDCVYNAPTPSSTAADQFVARAKREYVLHFMDPCAFYGNSYLTGLDAKNSDGTKVAVNGHKREKRNELYPILSKFRNRDRAYIDIRNEANYSYNYYGFVNDPDKKDLFSIYTDTIGLTFINESGGSPLSSPYYTSEWPLLIVQNSQFPTGNTKEKNILAIEMPRGNNTNATLFFSLGIRNQGPVGEAIDRHTSALSPSFGELILQPAATTYDPYELVIPNNAEAGATTIIPIYSRVKYLRRVAQVTEGVAPADTEVQYIDNLFAPLLLKAKSGETRPSTYETEQYVDLSNVDQISKLEYVGNTQIAFSPNNVTLCCFPLYVRNVRNVRSLKISPTTEVLLRGATVEQYASGTTAPHGARTPDVAVQPIDLSPGSSKVVYFNRPASLFPRWLSKDDFDCVVSLIIEKNNYQSKILGTISGPNAANMFSPGFDVHLAIRAQSHRDETSGTSSPAVPFSKCSMFLRGFKLDGANVKVVELDTGILLYTKREPSA